MNPNIVATLMESTGKHQVILRPLMGSADFGQDDTQLRQANHWSKAAAAAKKAAGLENATWNEVQAYGYDRLRADTERINREMLAKTPHARPEQRVLEVDYIAPMPDNEEIMMAGIGPGRFQTYTTGMSSSSLQHRRHNTDFYESVKFAAAPNQFRTDRGVYVVTRKFQKLLTINAYNILSIDGKPLMGLGNVSRGVSQLGQFDESIDEARRIVSQPQQPAKPFRIVMRRGTIIDADHMAPMPNNDGVYLVGIGQGNGPTTRSHLRHPQPHPEFWILGHTKPGICRPNDPSHTDYLVTPKFQRVITMHAKNIRTINGKPVLDVTDTDAGASQLGQFDEWTIGDITGTLEE